MKYAAVWPVLLLACILANAQATVRVSGTVVDDQTEEPIPFVNVFLNGVFAGGTTDLDGRYSFEVERKADSLVASVVGYRRALKYLSGQPVQTVNFRLLRDDIMMDAVVITPGENPAFRILDSIYANKGRHDIGQNDSYQYEVYNKLELDISELNDKFMDRKLMKPIKFIFENIDSVSEEKPFLPLFMTETLSDFYFKRNPKATKEVIKASRVSGVENASVTQFLGNMYQQIDIYDNLIPVMGKNFVSPISNNGKFSYKYLLVDSAFIENRWCYQIMFKPKREQSNTFKGDFWVADTTFAVRRVSMELDGKTTNINFVEKLMVFQEFGTVGGNSHWVLEKDKLIVRFVSGKDSPGIIGRKSAYYADHIFNQTETRTVFADKQDLVVLDDAMDKGEDFWEAARHDSLSANEAAIYAMVDTLKKVPMVRTYIDIVTLVVTGYKEVGPVEIGPIFKLFSFNEVEGARFMAGLRTGKELSTRFVAGGYVAYGVRDKGVKYGLDFEYLLSKKPRQTLYALWRDDLDIQSESAEEFAQDNLLSGLVRRKGIPQKLTRLRTFKAHYERDWRLGLSSRLSVRHSHYDPYFNFYYFDGQADGQAADSTITTSEVGINTRFAFREKFLEGDFGRTSLGSKYPVLNFSYAIGLRGVLGSGFNYHRFEASLYDRFKLGPIGYSEYILKAGKIFGTLPMHLLYVFPGNETYFFNKNAFNRMVLYEFVADTYGTLFFTHHFDGYILNRVPFLRKLKWRLLVQLNVAVGKLSEGNMAANTDPTGNHSNFDNFEGQPRWLPRSPGLKDPYVEVGLGVENIFKLLRVDLIWRPNHNDQPALPGLRAGLQLKF